MGRGLFERLNVFTVMRLIGQLSTACLVLANLQSIAKPTSETGEAKKICMHTQQVGMNTLRKQSNVVMNELIR